jgi:hypothetical protein
MEGTRVICSGSVAVRKRYLNGEPARVGYLGGLRLDRSCRGRFATIRQGYQFFRELHERDPADFYLTSIVADNKPARRFLERGLPGMPAYQRLGEWVTLLFATRLVGKKRQADATFEASAKHLREIIDLLARSQRGYQFAPVWTADDFAPSTRTGGVQINDFQLISRADGTLRGCAALWDQRAIKQMVIRGYSPLLRQTRPLLNIARSIFGRPRLPRTGQTLATAFVSHLATDSADGIATSLLIDSLCAIGRQRGLDYLTIGFDARDPRLAEIRKTRQCREYVSQLYAVFWEDAGEMPHRLDGRLLAPEVALL